MPKIGRFDVSILLLCLLAAANANSTNDTTTTVTSTATASSRSSTSSTLLDVPTIPTTRTCPARTVNYITHTLPQQCLRTSRTALGNSTAATASDGTYKTANSTLSTAPAVVSTHAVANAAATIPANDTAPGEPTEPNISPTGHDVDADSIATPQPSATPDAVSFDPNSIASAVTEQETDSPLDNAKFVSFEEWKKQNLAKAGQSPEDVGKGRASAADGQRRPVINNALDSLGDEGEIELDFSGFGAGDDSSSRWTATAGSSQTASDASASPESLPANAVRARSKDAGTTCKERFNYASFDCAATILKTNSKVKSPSSVLVENKDSYMLNECGVDNKFIIVELCDDITIDTIVLANFEFFSSQFRTFRVSVSDRYPVKLDRWKDLGTFEARNSREIQAFAVHSNIWARYLRIEFLTHYGAEFYCPLSLVRVHGKTMMEEFRNQDEVAKGEDDDDDVPVLEPVALANTLPEQQPIETAPVTPEPVIVEKTASFEPEQMNSTMPTGMPVLVSNITEGAMVGTVSAAIDGSPSVTDTGVSTSQPQEPPESSVPLAIQPATNTTVLTKVQSTPAPSIGSAGDRRSSQPQASSSSKPVQGPEKSPTNSSPVVIPAASSPLPEQKLSSSSSMAASVKIDSKSVPASPEVVKSATPTTQQQSPTPTTQENFFKSVHKRLQMLESNSTLSLQYIEEQSRILRDAFMQVEKRQLGKTEKFLGTLNDSVMTELRWFRTQYDQLWQSTVIELETHQQQYQREMLAVSSRLTIMADELVFQKRMIVVQSTLLLLCLGLVIFVRSGSPYLELPLMQQVMNKSHSMLKLSFESPPGSPSSRESSPELRKIRRLVRQSSGTSEGSFESPLVARSTTTPGLEFSPPTLSDGHSERSSTPPLDAELGARVRQTKSGPATPSGTREHQNPLDWEDARSDSPVQKRGHHLSTGEGSSQPSSLRYSGSSDLDESTADREGARSDVGRDLPPQGKSGLSEGSSDDGDTMGELLVAGSFGD